LGSKYPTNAFAAKALTPVGRLQGKRQEMGWKGSREDLKRDLKSTIRYDSVYLTCSKTLMGSQVSPPHRTNKKLKCETKNK